VLVEFKLNNSKQLLRSDSQNKSIDVFDTHNKDLVQIKRLIVFTLGVVAIALS
jgi:hypothetical protein